MTEQELQEKVDKVMSALGYKRTSAVKDHRNVERYEAPGSQLQNVSKQLAILITLYGDTREREGRIDELESKRLQVQRIKRNIVDWSNTHESLGIGYVISNADSVDYHAKKRLAELKEEV